jgi:hypothetical protein
MISFACRRVFQSWGRSSAGRAPALQAGGHRFDPDRLHPPSFVFKRGETAQFPHGGNGSWRFVGMRPTHRNAGLLANHESRGILCWLTWSLYRGKSEFGVIMCVGKASCVVWSCRLSGRPSRAVALVLWKCESGSGASLGACDLRSVFGRVEGPVVRLTCLTPASLECNHSSFAGLALL